MSCSAKRMMSYAKASLVVMLVAALALVALVLPKGALAMPAEEPYPVVVEVLPQVDYKDVETNQTTLYPLSSHGPEEGLLPEQNALNKLFLVDHDVEYTVTNQDGKVLQPYPDFNPSSKAKYFKAMSTDEIIVKVNPATVPEGYHLNDTIPGTPDTLKPGFQLCNERNEPAVAGDYAQDSGLGTKVVEMHPLFSMLDVYFDALDGAFPDGTKLKKVSVNGANQIAWPEQPVMEGYKFLGWEYGIKTEDGFVSYYNFDDRDYYFAQLWDENSTLLGNSQRTPNFTSKFAPALYDGEFIVQAQYEIVSSLGPVDDVVGTEGTDISVPIPSQNIDGEVEVNLPDGLSTLTFDGKTLTGTLPPVSEGNGKDIYEVSVTGEGEDGETYNLTFTITVGKHGQIGPNAPQTYFVGDEATIDLNYKNIDGDLTVTIPDELPGLTYKDGHITGKVPDTITGDKQDYEIVLTGVGYDGKKVTDTLRVTVKNKLAIEQVPDQTYNNGDPVDVSIKVTPFAVDSVKVSEKTPLPQDLEYIANATVRKLSGNANVKFADNEAQKVFPVTIIATLGELTDEMTFNITVKNPNYVEPKNPDKPDQPDNPDKPDQPVTPVTPDKPDKPSGGNTGWTGGGTTPIVPGNAERFPLGKVPYVTKSTCLPKTSDATNVAAIAVGLAGLTLGTLGVMRRKVQ